MATEKIKKDFQKFYEEHIDKVYRYVFWRVNFQTELAEDLVSEIFLKALENFEKYDPAISVSAWIMTITKNHLTNHWRDSKATVSLPAKEDEENELDHLWYDLAKVNQEKVFSNQETQELLEKLEEIEKKVVTSHYLLGYSYSEIAADIGKSVGAVKVVAHRALKKLKNL